MTRGFTAADVPDQSGRTILVTGANTGLGFEAARVLAGAGARVLLGCRSLARATEAVDRIRRDHPAADLRIVELDQGDLASVRAAADDVATNETLDVLVNNAGIMMTPLAHTVDGFESQLGVNHLGTFALTGLLLPALAGRPDGRVVITSSIAHRPGRIHWDDLDATAGYQRQERYQQSKLANLLHHHELDRRLRAAGATTRTVACHPGLATTDLGRHLGPFVGVLRPVIRPFVNSAAAGAWPTLMAAVADLPGGAYVGPSKRGETAGPAVIVHSTDQARDPELGRRFWERSVELTGVDPGI